MTCDFTRERLQERIDRTLDPVLGRDVDRHLAECGSCRRFAADLAAIANAASALEPVDVPEHVWLQLAARWRRENPHAAASAPSRRSGRRTFRLMHVLAAAAVLTVAAGGAWIAWRATGPRSSEVLLARPAASEVTSNAPAAPLVESAQKDIEAAEQLYMGAITVFEEAAASQKHLLEPQVAATIDMNLEIIDEAIDQSRAAVRAHPQSPVARESLFEAFRKKVALLQNTISLVSEISRGNQAGASRLAGS